MKIAFLAEGNAESKDCWSGSALSFVRALRRRGAEVVTLDVALSGAARALAAASTFHYQRARWRVRYALHARAFEARSRQATRLLARVRPMPDAVVQIGGTFLTSLGNLRAPLVVYSDSNIRMAERGIPYSSAAKLTRREIGGVAAREQVVYGAADRVWCMSDFAARSFQSSFGLSTESLRTIYAGPNAMPAGTGRLPKRMRDGPPKVLFVGKDYVRKGLPTLIEAFRLVHEQLPSAELHVVGTKAVMDSEGVVFHGFLRGDREADRSRLTSLFQSSAAFCLPSHYEPFGIALVEAMHSGLACIGVDDWAMPEIIEDGRTGWLVDPRSVAALADALLEALRSPARSAAMGRAGVLRAQELFTWDRAAEWALEDLAILRGHARLHGRPT